MKIGNLTTVVLLLGGAILTCQSAFGQGAVANDLYMGFQNQSGGGTEDYIINFGPASGITNKSTVVNLSSDFSLSDFDAVLGTSSSVQGGVIGVSANGSPSDVFVTQLRVGGAGTPSVPGSHVAVTLTRAQDNSTFAGQGTLDSPAAGSGTLDGGKTWESLVDPAGTATSFPGVTGLNPDSTVAPSSVLYEDLWITASSSIIGGKPFVYLGYFTLDLTGATPKLTFTSTIVPASLSSPKILSVGKVASTVTVVSGNVSSGHSYQLQFATSLSAPVSWANVGSAVVASGTTVTNADSSASGGQRFYRVSAQ